MPLKISEILDKLPAMSPNINKLLVALRADFTEPKVLETLLIASPVISGRVLQIANSSFYGLSRQINSLREASIILGQHTLRGLIYSLAVLEKFKGPTDPEIFSYQAIWSHSLYAACLTKVMAEDKKLDTENLFTAALFQHFGLLILDTIDKDTVRKALKLSDTDNISLKESVEKVSTINYINLSYEALSYWHFPENTCAYISNIEKEPNELRSSILKFSDIVSSAFYKTPLNYGTHTLDEATLTTLFPDQTTADSYLRKADDLYQQLAVDLLS